MQCCAVAPIVVCRNFARTSRSPPFASRRDSISSRESSCRSVKGCQGALKSFQSLFPKQHSGRRRHWPLIGEAPQKIGVLVGWERLAQCLRSHSHPANILFFSAEVHEKKLSSTDGVGKVLSHCISGVSFSRSVFAGILAVVFRPSFHLSQALTPLLFCPVYADCASIHLLS